jgi:hypothetical protein
VEDRRVRADLAEGGLPADDYRPLMEAVYRHKVSRRTAITVTLGPPRLSQRRPRGRIYLTVYQTISVRNFTRALYRIPLQGRRP